MIFAVLKLKGKTYTQSETITSQERVCVRTRILQIEFFFCVNGV
jgi:hypothetical protein